MCFKTFNEEITKFFKELCNFPLFTVEVNKEEMWELYLDSFKEGDNPIFRERREMDCQCCKSFFKKYCNIVAINEHLQIVSVWDFHPTDEKYTPVVKALSEYIKGKPIESVFLTREEAFGVSHNYEQLENGDVTTWYHFFVSKIPRKFRYNGTKSVENVLYEKKISKRMLKEALEEFTEDSFETVLELIASNSLYKGEEVKSILENFLTLKKEFSKIKKNRDAFLWKKSFELGDAVCRLKGRSIGTLLEDLSKEVEFEVAVRRYLSKVDPENYQRSNVQPTKKMMEAAKERLLELGLDGAIYRRHCKPEDISVNDVFWVDVDVEPTLKDNDPWAAIPVAKSNSFKEFKNLEEVGIEDFIEKILPTTKKLSVLVENSHIPNFVSIIGAQEEGKRFLKWDNDFCHIYNGSLSDASMKQRVKELGGKVEGDVRATLQWNENGENNDDLDLHCQGPNLHIYFRNQTCSCGELDVDIRQPKYEIKNETAVENIIFPDKRRIPPGKYIVFVNQYSNRDGKGGFRFEIELEGKLYSYEYLPVMRTGSSVNIAEITVSKDNELSITHYLPVKEGGTTKEVWGITTGEFVPVQLVTHSPNYWRENRIGNRHYIFILKGCKTPDPVSGFLNEFLREDLREHRKSFEALTNYLKVQPAEEQLSGLGFSSTRRNSLVVEVEGNIKRRLKVLF